MYKNKFFLIIFLLSLLSACHRQSPSPVEIKIDDDLSYSQTESYKNEKRAAIESSVENIYENTVEKEEKKDEVDEQFEEIMAEKGSASKSKNAQSSSDEISNQEEALLLSKPRITKPAVGESSTNIHLKNISKSEKLSSVKTSSASKALKFQRPVDGKIISKFGDDMNGGIINDGINIKAPSGSKIKAAQKGVVIYAGNKLEEDFGNVVIIQHDNDLITSYAHLKDIIVKNNANVDAGDIVGTVGKTGDVTEPQLHFEVMKNKKPVNPMSYLQN